MTISAPAPASSAATNTTRPRNSARNPSWQTRRGDACGNTFGIPTAAMTSVIDSGRMRSAGVDRREPERDREEQRHREEQPGLEQVLEEERGEPAAQQPDPQDRGIEQRGSAGVASVLLPREEPEQHHAAAEDQPDHRRQPQPRGRIRLRLHESPRPGAQDPVDDEAQPERRERGADEVEAGAFLLRRVGGAPVEEEHDPDDEHLADEHVSPRPVRGEQPADQRAERDGDRAARHHDAVGAGPLALDEVRRHQRHDRRHHQRGADALEERPAEHQHREVGRQRGRQRTARVDHAADRERALAAEDRAHLPAGDHQRRHHQRVHGDRGLDPGDRRARGRSATVAIDTFITDESRIITNCAAASVTSTALAAAPIPLSDASVVAVMRRCDRGS